MKNWLKKCSVALLVLSMIGTTMPVYAADAPAAEEQTTEYQQTEGKTSESQADESLQQEEQPAEEEQTTKEQQSVGENDQGEAAVQEHEEVPEQEDQTEQSRMNYAYVESPYLETPDTQRIVVSWGEEDEYIDQMVLHVRKDDDTWEDWYISRSEGNLYLFEKYYEDEYQGGTYEVVSISVTEIGETTDYALSDLGVEARFGVNQEYDGIDELQPIDEDQEAAVAEDAANVSISTINEDGTIEEQNSIEDALDAARTDVLASTPAMMSLDDDSGISTQAARSGKIVVALDPGHDDRDAGASYYGLKEEVLTLKIANYCKAELEQYYGVEVYMTRTSSACPYPNASPAGGCITARANAAAKAGAKIFVSFHLNAVDPEKTDAEKVCGAEVIIPNFNWKADVGAQGQDLATKILSELTSLGLYNRGLYYKTGTDPKYKYPDGSLEDWFTVQVANKYNGIPGIIVEHAFITNSGDVNNVLNTEAGLKRLGVADATGIANYLGLSKEKVEWKTANGKTYCYINDQKVTGERRIGANWYYFDGNGVMQTGFVNLGSKVVYYNSDGQMQYGEQKINNAWYYFDTITGARTTGFYKLPGKTVYYGTDGKMRYGEQCINGSWYYLNPITGARTTGFCNLPGKTVYYNTDGKMLYGEQKIGNYYYYFDPVFGTMYTGWKTINKKTRLYQKNGQCVIGESPIDGYWYYFDGNGVMQTGFVNLGDKTAYYNSAGQMQYGEQCINGSWYYLNPITGARTTGFCNLPGKTVYYNTDGKMLYKEQKIGSYYYYFDAVTGAMIKNTTVNGRYYNSEGKRVEKQQDASHLIVNNATTNVTQMVQFYKNTGNVYPADKLKKGGADSIEKFANIYYEEATAEGVDPAVAWCQSMKETGWLRFGGQVKIEQFNFAGLGATDNGASGADFSKYGENGVRMGVRAQIQHLKAYAVSGLTEKDLKYACVDPRFSLVNKGSAKYVEWLGTHENPIGAGWATGVDYGPDIIKLMNQLER